MELILDTNAVSALFTGDKPLGELLATADRHHLPIHVIAEYQYGLLASRRRRRLQSLLRRLEANSFVLYPDRETADVYARIRFDLKRQGTPIPENDVWIAALAKQFSLEIVSRDPHFDRVAGIRRLGW
jgi:tRNA(fMet)-specific endonuclease VapC